MTFLIAILARIAEWGLTQLAFVFQRWWTNHEKEVQEKKVNDAAEKVYSDVIAKPDASREDRKDGETNFLNS